MKKVLCYFSPTTLASDGSNAGYLRECLEAALADTLTPATLPTDAQRRALDVPSSLLSKVETVAKRSGLAPGRVIGGLVLAVERSRADAANSRITPALEGLRPAQCQSVSAAAEHLQAGRWVLLEAGTGSGKSRIASHLASFVLALRDSGHDFSTVDLSPTFQIAQTPNAESTRGKMETRAARKAKAVVKDSDVMPRTVIISAPTTDNLRHLIAEFELVRAHIDPQKLIRIAIVIGRQQFVSISAITELLADQTVPDAGVAQWLAAGMPAGLTRGSQMLASMHPGICGLAEDLRQVATDFPIDDALLDDTSLEGEASWYETLRSSAMTADILYATHAMLASDNLMLQRERGRLLPAPLALFIDEAHAFEGTQAQIGTSGIAMSRLLMELRSAPWSQARAKVAAASALAAAAQAEEALRSIPNDIPLPVSRISDDRSRRAWIHCAPALARLNAALVQLRKKVSEPPPALRSAASLIRRSCAALDGIENGYSGAVTFSPMRRYPNVMVGPRSVEEVLSMRWQSTPCGILMSGTLLYPGVSGPMSAPVIAKLLLPARRTVSIPPLHPHWLKSTPTVYTPAESAVPAFTPPGGDLLTPSALRQWLTNVATVITRFVASDAAGGTLVLMTGYERVHVLAQILKPALGDRLIEQHPTSMPVGIARTEFVRRSALGQRPLWIATGGAGTGLDLRDETIADSEADKDLLLTDLVIPALPFGMARSSIHLARADWLGFGAEKQEALRMFQQWLGRLIRREGLQHRRLWILDGRLFLPSTRQWTHEFLRIVQSYPKRKEIPLKG